jgi:hypothetical protein
MALIPPTECPAKPVRPGAAGTVAGLEKISAIISQPVKRKSFRLAGDPLNSFATRKVIS